MTPKVGNIYECIVPGFQEGQQVRVTYVSMYKVLYVWLEDDERDECSIGEFERNFEEV